MSTLILLIIVSIISFVAGVGAMFVFFARTTEFTDTPGTLWRPLRFWDDRTPPEEWHNDNYFI